MLFPGQQKPYLVSFFQITDKHACPSELRVVHLHYGERQQIRSDKILRRLKRKA